MGEVTSNNDYFYDGPTAAANKLDTDSLTSTCTNCLPGTVSGKVGSFQGLTIQWLVANETAQAYPQVTASSFD